MSKYSDTEKRKWPRYYIKYYVPATVEYRNGQTCNIRIKNLSLDGVLCFFPEKLDMMEKVKVSIDLPSPDKKLSPTNIYFMAKVVRIEADNDKVTRKYRKTVFKCININDKFGSFLQAFLDLESSRGNVLKLK